MVIRISPGESRVVSEKENVEYYNTITDDLPVGVEKSKARAYDKQAQAYSQAFHYGQDTTTYAATGITLEIDGSPSQQLNVEVRQIFVSYFINAVGTATAALELGTFLKPVSTSIEEAQYRNQRVDLSAQTWADEDDSFTYTESNLGLQSGEMSDGDRYHIGIYVRTSATASFVLPVVPSGGGTSDVYINNDEPAPDDLYHLINFEEIALSWG